MKSPVEESNVRNNATVLRSMVEKFIMRGEEIKKNEHHDPYKGSISHATDPDFKTWMGEINIFNDRYLKKHPLHNSIHLTYFFNNSSSLDDMLGHLRALSNDNEFVDNAFLESARPNLTSTNSLFSEQDKRYILDKERNKDSKEYIEPMKNSKRKQYDVFISHANKDKLKYVNELHMVLQKLGISIFFDSEIISWGDDWKQTILEGTTCSEFAIIIISNQFFGREWTERELNELMQRQNESGQKIVLPLLYDITFDEFRKQYPDLEHIQGIRTNDHSKEDIAILLAKELIKRYR